MIIDWWNLETAGSCTSSWGNQRWKGDTAMDIFFNRQILLKPKL